MTKNKSRRIRKAVPKAPRKAPMKSVAELMGAVAAKAKAEAARGPDIVTAQMDAAHERAYGPLRVVDNDDDIPWVNGGPLPKIDNPDEDTTAGPKHRVTLIPDHCLDYPCLYLDVYIEGPPEDTRGFAELFARAGCMKASSPEDADLVVFAGGADVHPSLYGEVPHPKSHPDDDRDTRDLNVYVQCLEQGIPMFGVCRGAQFGAVMSGAKLFQDVDNHYGDHSMIDLKTMKVIDKVSSVHHQAVRRTADMEVIATSAKSKNRIKNDQETDTGANADIEAFFFRENCFLGVQGHPEYRNYNAYAVWCLKQIEEYVVLNPDVEWSGPPGSQRRRLTPDVVNMRTPRPLLSIPPAG